MQTQQTMTEGQLIETIWNCSDFTNLKETSSTERVYIMSVLIFFVFHIIIPAILVKSGFVLEIVTEYLHYFLDFRDVLQSTAFVLLWTVVPVMVNRLIFFRRLRLFFERYPKLEQHKKVLLERFYM